MKCLNRSYVTCFDLNKVSGNDRKKCNFYDELNEIFSRDDAIQPNTLCSKLDGSLKRSKEAVQSDPEKPPVVNRKEKIPERKKRVEDLVGLFKEFTQDRKEEKRKKINKLGSMHNAQRMTLMNRFYDQ